ncbi:MAG: hypothetical protein H6624_15450 [Bdellovibrionaceae bacterium]|nr:hypothetical protein [Pseudobdellovibrionaceae bacterium]
MNAAISSIMTMVFYLTAYAGIIFGAGYSAKAIHDKVQYLALEKAAQGLGRLEPMAQRMTGGKLDY